MRGSIAEYTLLTCLALGISTQVSSDILLVVDRMFEESDEYVEEDDGSISYAEANAYYVEAEDVTELVVSLNELYKGTITKVTSSDALLYGVHGAKLTVKLNKDSKFVLTVKGFDKFGSKVSTKDVIQTALYDLTYLDDILNEE